MIRKIISVLLSAVFLVYPALSARSADQIAGALPPESAYGALQWRGIGPFRGGRAVAAAGVPGLPNVFYFGAAAGGVWKTMDAGKTWKPIFDGVKVSSIGAIAVARSNPSILYVGTGEGNLRGNVTWGGGMFKSTDAGATWADLGLNDTRQIGAVIVDPVDPNIVLVAAIGHAFGPNSQRGVFRTTDGGKNWSRVLYKNDLTGAIDLVADPRNANIVYAALWQVRRQPWNFASGGPGSGLYRSLDGGLTWSQLTGHGLPTGILGRIDVAISAVDPHRIYAMIEAADGGLYRSDDAGGQWRRVSDDGRLRQRAWYFSKIYADPNAIDTVYALNTGMLRSVDGGKTFNLVSATHGDHHALWIDPNNSNSLINANDGGASISLDGGNTWSTQENQPTGQFYHVSTDNRFPYYIYGAQQDNSNLAVASFGDEGVIGPRDWYPAGGGESGFVVPDPRDPNIIYSDAENQYQRFDRRSLQSQSISPDPIDNSGHPASELDHRFNWTAPLMLSPHDPEGLYAASEVVWKSTDRGMSWKIISPDLTRNDKSKQTASGGPLTKDITSVEYYDTIFALAESPLRKGKLWVGTDDGLVQLSDDDGAHWRNITPAAMPAWSTVSTAEPSHFDAATAYIAVDRHRLDDIAPYAWKTADNGKTWVAIAAGLPQGAVVHVVREDPVRRGLLYAGTEVGPFVSFDDGAHWSALQHGMPVTPVHDLTVHGDDLVAATHGRGFWILDNVTPLRQVQPAAEDLVLYSPATALRLYYPQEVNSRRPVGPNPPAGAIIDYVLDGAAAPTELTVDIFNAQGELVRHLSSTKTNKEVQPPEWPDRLVPSDLIPAHAGMNRLVWDLRYDDPMQIPGAFYQDQAPRGPLVAPGHYQVRLTLGNKSRNANLTIIADPRSGDRDGAIAAKTALALATYKDIDALHRAVNDIRARRIVLKGSPAAHDDAKLANIEEALMQVKMNGSEANLAFPGMLNEQLAAFAGTLEDADTAPTQQQQALYESLHERLQTQLGRWRSLSHH
ncbi:MAG: glycosyl hydrolase [Pseudomonadota bacterium]|nr:glycosyl hydrolase [Pseudomonadota bacterium]